MNSLYSTGTESAQMRKQRALDLGCAAASKEEPHFTISVGAAAYPAAGQDYENLYLSADHAMYVSKKTGKNRIHVDNGTVEKNDEK